MKSGDKYVNLELKRFLSHNRMKDNFLDYLRDGQFEHVSRIYPVEGLFTYPVSITYPGSTGAGFVDFGPDPLTGTDGEGHILEGASGSVLIDVPFEDTAGNDYWFALHYCEIPSGIYLNPRTGLPEYDNWEEQIGVSANPNTVVDAGGGNITFTVNSVCASGEDYSGKEVTVWLNNPVGTTAASAIQTVTVAYGAPNNTITTASADYMGQSSPSLTASDYTVCLRGITWKDAGATPTVNPFTSDYTILGFVTGGGASTITDQRDLSGGANHTLQKAYDGAGAGAGRSITANDQAVRIAQENNTMLDKDIGQAALRIVKDLDTNLFTDAARDYETGIDIQGREQSYAGLMYRAAILDEGAGTDVLRDEPVNVNAGNIVTFTRGAADLQFSSSGTQAFIDGVDLIEISGSALGNDGLYIITITGGTTLTVTHLDGSAVTFALEVGLTANLYRPVTRIAGGDGKLSSGIIINTLGDVYNSYVGPSNPRAGISIYCNSLAPNNDELIRADRNGTDIFRVQADADVFTTGDMTATGNIVSVGGYMDASTTITAGTDITSTAGNIEVTNAGKDFIYGSARTFYDVYPAQAITYNDAYFSFVNGGPGNASYIRYDVDPALISGRTARVYIKIPNGATLVELKALVLANSAVDLVEFAFAKMTVNWGAATSSRAVYVSKNSSGASTQVITLTSPADFTADVYDGSSEAFVASFSGNGAAVVGSRIYAVRAQYTWDTIKP